MRFEMTINNGENEYAISSDEPFPTWFATFLHALKPAGIEQSLCRDLDEEVIYWNIDIAPQGKRKSTQAGNENPQAEDQDRAIIAEVTEETLNKLQRESRIEMVPNAQTQSRGR